MVDCTGVDPPVTKLAGPNLIAVSKLCGVRPEWLANGTPPMRVGSDGAVPSSMWGYEGVTPEAAELGRDWAQLEEPTRSVIRDLIVMAVAAQKRRGKTKRLTEHRPTQPALSVHEP